LSVHFVGLLIKRLHGIPLVQLTSSDPKFQMTSAPSPAAENIAEALNKNL